MVLLQIAQMWEHGCQQQLSGKASTPSVNRHSSRTCCGPRAGGGEVEGCMQEHKPRSVRNSPQFHKVRKEKYIRLLHGMPHVIQYACGEISPLSQTGFIYSLFEPYEISMFNFKKWQLSTV